MALGECVSLRRVHNRLKFTDFQFTVHTLHMSLANAFVTINSDHCIHLVQGWLLQCCTVGLPKCDIDRLQSIINAAAHLTSDSCRYDQVTPLLNDLHWFRVPEHITYKLCVLVYNCLHGTAPQYLQDIIQPVAEVTSCHRLRSAFSSALVVPATRRSLLGDRAFAVAGPCTWNSLPEFVTWLLVTSHLQEISQDLLI